MILTRNGDIMPSPSKNKGNSWERDVAKELSKLYGETFIRAPGSGAYTGGFNSHRKEYLHEGQIRSFKGDIIPGQSFPKMNAECKSYGEFPFHQLLQITRKIKFVAIPKHGPPFSFEGMPSMVYESSKYGSWIICEYDRFWATNAAAVKAMCSAQVTAS
jgi:hypothetical protein